MLSKQEIGVCWDCNKKVKIIVFEDIIYAKSTGWMSTCDTQGLSVEKI